MMAAALRHCGCHRMLQASATGCWRPWRWIDQRRPSCMPTRQHCSSAQGFWPVLGHKLIGTATSMRGSRVHCSTQAMEASTLCNVACDLQTANYRGCSSTARMPSRRVDNCTLDSSATYAQRLSPKCLAACLLCIASEPARSGTVKLVCRCAIFGVPGEQAPDFTDALLGYGAAAAWIQEEIPCGGQEQPIFIDPEPGVGQGKLWIKAVWHNCKVVALFDSKAIKEDMESIIQSASTTAGVTSPLELAWSDVHEEDWEAQVKASYKPLQLTEDLWIVPEWCERPEPEKTNIILKPGIAFGTGEHATTRMCLKWLQAAPPGQRIIDYGCGSGILTIAACAYGAQSVVATDIDPLAVHATEANIDLNGMRERCQALLVDPFVTDAEPLGQAGVAGAQGGFGVLVANILKPALLDLRPRLCGYVRAGGTLVLSGLLTSQVDTVKAAYASDVEWQAQETDDGWAMMVGQRLANS